MATLDLRQQTPFSRLRGLLEVTRLMRSGHELPELLDAIARTISDSLGFRTVVINLYRREWDDFLVTTVFGSDAAREALLGRVVQVADWADVLDERFLQRGAYLVPHGEIDWSARDGFTPDLPETDDPDAWHPEDALFAPMRDAAGRLIGVVSVDEPSSGHKPTGDEIEMLVTLAEHAALAVQTAQEATLARQNRDALEHLLGVSANLNDLRDTRELLERVCEAISEALGFERVAVRLLDGGGRHVAAVAVGFAPGDNTSTPLTADQLDLLLRPEFDVNGCFLIPDEAANALIQRESGFRSRRDGRGPHAWSNHWLLVPLDDRRGHRIGYLWVDDPVDRLLPSPGLLKILRAFANLAVTALDQASQFEAVQNSNERYRALIEASPVAIMDIDFDGRVRSWNAGARAIFGWLPEETVGQVNPTVPPEDLPFFLANLQRIRAGETLRDLDLQRLHRDGTPIDISVAAGPIRDAHGDVVGSIALMVDVTERKRSERELIASEARKDAILRGALDCVVLVDEQGLIVEVNPATEETFGWTRVEAIGKSFLELAVAEADRAEVAALFAAPHGPLLGARLEIAAQRSDGRTFPAEAAITRVDVSGPLVFAVSIRDVTRRRDYEARLRTAEAKYRTLVEKIPIATYVNELGSAIRTTSMSPQIEDLVGYPVSAWMSPDFLPSIIHPEDRERVLAEIERTRRSSEDFRAEYRLLKPDGSVVWVLDETAAVRDEQYRPLLLQGYMLDVTARHADDPPDGGADAAQK